jgi:hypothetical protein
MELASVLHQALEVLLRAEKDEQCRGASEFFSPYEMAQRGSQDVLQSLRQVNETLEEKIKLIVILCMTKQPSTAPYLGKYTKLEQLML